MELCRVDFALIPEDPLFRAVVEASQAITDEFYYNANVIDDKKFPPHLSLHICTIPRDTLPQVVAALKGLAATKFPNLVPIEVERADGGYVMLNIARTDALLDLHEAILNIAAEARQGLGQDRFGNPYIRNLFTPHISLAKIDYRDQSAAVTIGRENLGELSIARVRALDVCDIGERSERWEVLASFAG
jgi:hypothetical protein